MKKEKKEVKQDGKKANFFKKHRTGVIIVAILILVVVGVGSCVATGINSAQDMMTETYATTTLEKRNIINSVSVNGTVASEQQKDVSVAVTNTDILEIKVEVGDVVSEGDIIAILDTTDIEESLEEAKQNLIVASSQSNSSISTAADSLANTQENADINEARAIESETAAYNDYAAAGADEATAQSEYNSAVSDKTAAKTAYDEAVANTAAAQAAYDAAMVANSVDEAAFETALEAVKSADADSPLVHAWDTVTVSQGSTNLSTLTIHAAINDETDLANADSAWIEGATTVADAEANRAAIESAISNAAAAQVDATTYSNAVTACATEQATLTAAETAEATALADYNSKVTTAESKLATYEAATATREAKGDIYQSAAESYDDLVRTNETSIETQQDNLNTSRLNATTATITQENQVEMYEEQLEDCIIRAPFDGTITAVNFEEGDTYTGVTLYTIQNVETLIISVDVDEYDISDIEKGMNVIFKTDTTGDEEMVGEVTFVSPVPNVGTSTSVTYPIEITIVNPNERLRLGMTAQANIILDEVQDVFAVPYECVQSDPDGNYYVNVIVENTVAETEDASNRDIALAGQQTEKVYVEVGLVTDYYTEISGKDLVEGMEIQLSYLDTSVTTEQTGVVFGPGRNQ